MPGEEGGRTVSSVTTGAAQAGEAQPQIRLIVAGGPGVGKSALSVRFLTRRFIGEYEHAPELLYSKTMDISGRRLELEVVDTSRREVPPLLAGHLLLVVYSITERSSLDLAGDILRNSAPIVDNRQVILLGNKADLQHLRQVDTCEGEALSNQYKIAFSEVSAAEGGSCLDSLLHSAILQLAQEPGQKTRKQPVWSMRGVLEGLLGTRSSLPPELGDSRRSRRSIKEVFKKRSV